MSRDASTEETALAWMNRTYPGLTPEGLSGLCALLAEPGRALIALDFDGTLAPIVLDPAQARALPAAVTALADLATLVGTLAVLTGRPARTAVEYAALDQVPGVVVLGHYGRQRWHDGQLDAPPAPAGLAIARERLPSVLAAAAAAEGTWVEDKGDALAVHTRRAADPVAALGQVRAPLLQLAVECVHLERVEGKGFDQIGHGRNGHGARLLRGLDELLQLVVLEEFGAEGSHLRRANDRPLSSSVDSVNEPGSNHTHDRMESPPEAQCTRTGVMSSWNMKGARATSPHPDQRFAEPVTLSSTARADVPLPRTAFASGFNLLTFGARRRSEPKASRRGFQGGRKRKCRTLRRVLFLPGEGR